MFISGYMSRNFDKKEKNKKAKKMVQNMINDRKFEIQKDVEKPDVSEGYCEKNTSNNKIKVNNNTDSHKKFNGHIFTSNPFNKPNHFNNRNLKQGTDTTEKVASSQIVVLLKPLQEGGTICSKT